MEIEDSSSLVYMTYYMMNWEQVSQSPSTAICASCGGAMMAVEPARDKKGLVFDGLVCHKCKTILWSRRT